MRIKENLPPVIDLSLQPHLLESVIREAADAPVIALDTETTGLVNVKEHILGWSLAFNERRVVLTSGAHGMADMLPHFRRLFADKNKHWAFANAKFDLHMLANHGYLIDGIIMDTQVMHGLLHEEDPHGLKAMSEHILGWSWQGFEEVVGKINKNNPAEKAFMEAWTNHHDLAAQYMSCDAYGTLQLALELQKRLAATETQSWCSYFGPCIQNLWDYFYNTEVPFTKSLWGCERKGMLTDTAVLDKAEPKAEKDLEVAEGDCWAAAGLRLDIGSAKALGEYFHGDLGIPIRNKTEKGAPSMDEKALQYIAESADPAEPNTVKAAEVATLILVHRSQSKLLTTYIRGFKKWRDAAGRIHTTLKQVDVRTGRLSCVAPWTKIDTHLGPTAAADVVVGDLVLTHNGRWRKVLRSFSKGVDHMFDVRFSTGQVLTCTADHRLLQADGQWVRVGVLIDEYLETVGIEHCSPGSSTEAVQRPDVPNDGADSRHAEHNATQRGARAEALHAGSGTQSLGEGALLSIEDGEQEPHEGEDWYTAPQLEGALSRWLRLLHLHAQRQEALRASCSDDGSAWGEEASREHAGAPHRWRHVEQRAGQPGAADPLGTRRRTLLAVEGLTGCTVEEIVYRGRVEVRDLTVEEDESYAACGVFSHNSRDPNLQNIPRAENDKWNLRGSFIARPGYQIVAFDYKQLEMRILAIMSGEVPMQEIFHRNWDIHMGNAATIYGLEYSDIEKAKKVDKLVKEGKLPESDMTPHVLRCLSARNDAKTIGFALNYGQGAYSLSKNLKCTLQEAEDKIANYKAKYSAVDQFLKSSIAMAERHGCVYTMLGRRRQVPDIYSRTRSRRSRGERVATNTRIQGSAADVAKLAMTNYDRSGIYELTGGEMIMQIHDELLFEVPIENTDVFIQHTKAVMEAPLPMLLSVKLETDHGKGKSWGSAK
jgi:DNA polymerase I-like protein with 3'-5' exonuclease and polymerase domains